MPSIQISDNENEVMNNPLSASKRQTPVQDALKEKISQLRTKLVFTERRKNSLIADGTEHATVLKLCREIDGCEKLLKKQLQTVFLKKIENPIKQNCKIFTLRIRKQQSR